MESNEKTKEMLAKFVGNVPEKSKQKKVITTSDGLLERIDRTLITEDGKQLLKG